MDRPARFTRNENEQNARPERAPAARTEALRKLAEIEERLQQMQRELDERERVDRHLRD